MNEEFDIWLDSTLAQPRRTTEYVNNQQPAEDKEGKQELFIF